MAAEGVVWRGVAEFEAGIARMLTAAEEAGAKAVKTSAALMVREARLQSTGEARPPARDGGPGVVTGAHRRGIQVIKQGWDGHSYSATIAPTLIYSRRLELGFEATDSLGRRYHQPPYPYFQPAYDRVMKDGPEIFRQAWLSALGLSG